MKRILVLSFLILSISMFSMAQLAVIQGKWNRNAEEIALSQIISGRLEPFATYKLQGDRAFSFAVAVKEPGFYVIGADSPKSLMNKYVLYIKPGDQVNLAVDGESYKLIGKNSPENIALEAWHDKILPLEKMSVYFFSNFTTYVDFFPLLDEFVAEDFVPKKTKNKAFEAAFESYRKFDLIGTALHFLHTPRTVHPEIEDYTDFYRTVDLPALTKDASILAYPFGSSLISQLQFLNTRLQGAEKPYTLDEELALLQNDTVKGEYVTVKAVYNKTYVGLQAMLKPVQQYILTDDQKARITQVEEKLAQEKVDGEPAIDFTYQDIDGEEVSLADFKGKVVLIDVWATWCGPCKAEIPHLKKLIEDYAGKDVVFMSVSLDEVKDFEKWKQFVKEEDLTGVQLFAGGFGSDIARLNGINAIPRFMLVDKIGNMVSKNSPRPSSAELRVLLDSELKK